MPDNSKIACNRCTGKEMTVIHTRKVYDSCRDKECLRDLKVYLTGNSQNALENAINVKPDHAELLWVYVDVDQMPYNRGHYAVNVKYFYKVVAEVMMGVGCPRRITGLAVRDKRVVLFGSDGCVRSFSSQYGCLENVEQNVERSNLPVAVVEAAEPVLLGLRTEECRPKCECGVEECIPEGVRRCFEEELADGGGGKSLYASIGQFSIVTLERETRLAVSGTDAGLPEKKCCGSSDDPCALFGRFDFPVDEFYPPNKADLLGGCDDRKRRR